MPKPARVSMSSRSRERTYSRGLMPSRRRLTIGIADELAGTVIRHLAPAVYVVHRHAQGRQRVRRGKDVVERPPAAERVDVRMLQEQERAIHLAVGDAGVQRALQIEPGGVSDRSQPRRSARPG